ncbi:MAG: type II secretion system F family protein [Candidatus Nealsonbacteria bacterium]|nr:type II secretion system F family protein [Candidatus Nealsonbacteria bacterium]
MSLEEEKMLFAQHLSLMIKGGVSLTEAISTLRREVKSGKFKKAIEDILKRVLAGEKLGNSLASHPRIFDKFYQNIVRVGEESGTLEENLKYLAQKLQRDIETGKKMRSALVYPAIIVSLAVVIVFIVTFFVLPKITALFQSLQIPLPFTTRLLIDSISFLKSYWLAGTAALVVLILAVRLTARLKATRIFWDKLSLGLPVLGRVFKNFNLAFFSRNFYTLLKSGIPLLDALTILAETAPSAVYARDLEKIRLRVERGEKISEGLKAFDDKFPPVFSEMVLVGERSGTLEESFAYLSDYHEKETDQVLKNLSNLIEPVLMILIGVFVGFVAVAIITPVYQFTGQLRFR